MIFDPKSSLVHQYLVAMHLYYWHSIDNGFVYFAIFWYCYHVNISLAVLLLILFKLDADWFMLRGGNYCWCITCDHWSCCCWPLHHSTRGADDLWPAISTWIPPGSQWDLNQFAPLRVAASEWGGRLSERNERNWLAHRAVASGQVQAASLLWIQLWLQQDLARLDICCPTSIGQWSGGCLIEARIKPPMRQWLATVRCVDATAKLCGLRRVACSSVHQ